MTQKVKIPNFKTDAESIRSNVLSLIDCIKSNYIELENIDKPQVSDLDSIDKNESLLSEQFTILSYLNSLKSNKELEDLEEELIKPYSELASYISFNKNLYKYFCKLSKTKLNDIQQYTIQKIIKDFESSGLNLEPNKQIQLNDINVSLSSLCNKYAINVKNSKDASVIFVKDSEKDTLLDGVKDEDLARFKSNSIEKGMPEHYLVTILPQDYSCILEDCNNKSMRKALFLKNTFVATKQINETNFDNTQIVKKVLSLRDQKSKLLGFKNFAEFSLNKKLAKDPKKVFDLLYSIKEKAIPFAQYEMDLIKEYSKDIIEGDFENWDFAYVANKYKKEFYSVSNDEVEHYFNLESSLNGLSHLIKNLFNFDLKEVPIECQNIISDYSRKFEISQNDKTVAYIYCDFIARSGKHSGAWMNDFSEKTSTNIPVAFVTCNFKKPINGLTRMSIRDIETLFHEFGHALHHTLTVITESGASGLSGVPRDAVEVPSTFMEFFCSDPNLLRLMSCHEITKDVIPEELLDKIKKADNFLAAQQLLRQVDFSLMDMIIHTEKDSDPKDVFDEIKKESNLMPIIQDSNFCNQFGHLFGGYSAGYYSYLWSEIYASNIFDSFDNGNDSFIDLDIGLKYLTTILSKGGSKDFHSLFLDFKGSELDIDILFKYRNINVKSPVVIVAQRYLELLKDTNSENDFINNNSLHHLKWMLEEITSSDMPETKSNRWLGFIQANLGFLNIIDIEQERLETRSIFNGN